nr:transcription factor bye1-like [Aedes albopictus]
MSDTDGATGHEEEANCVVCQRPDNAEDMVQCDRCDTWKHYTCAGVDEDIASRSFVCGNCTAHQTNDVISVCSGSSRSSSASVFSICLSQLVERQQLERARLEVELQRQHLEEQQKLIDKVLEGGETDNNRKGGVNDAATPPSSNMRLKTPLPPGAPLASAARRSVPTSSGTPKTTAPVMVSIPLSVLEPKTVESMQAEKDLPKSATAKEPQATAPVMVSIPLSELQPKTVEYLHARKDPQAALLKLRNRVEHCENRANPTPEELAELRFQVEMCRKLLETLQPNSEPNQTGPPTNAGNQPASQIPQLATNTSRVVGQTGTIPKVNRSLPVVPENDQPPPHYYAEDGAVGGIQPSNDMWPLRKPVSQTGRAPVSVMP